MSSLYEKALLTGILLQPSDVFRFSASSEKKENYVAVLCLKAFLGNYFKLCRIYRSIFFVVPALLAYIFVQEKVLTGMLGS